MDHEISLKISVSGIKTYKFSSKSTNVYKKFRQKKLSGIFAPGWRKALDYTLPLNALTLCSDRKRVLATWADILNVENEPSKIPAVYEFMGIFELPNPGDFRDQRTDLSARNGCPMLRHRTGERVSMESETSGAIFLAVPSSSGRNHETLRR
jgi:hypothetical protein